MEEMAPSGYSPQGRKRGHLGLGRRTALPRPDANSRIGSETHPRRPQLTSFIRTSCDAKKAGGLGDSLPRGRRLIDGGNGPRDVEVVVEGSPDFLQGGVTSSRRPPAIQPLGSLSWQVVSPVPAGPVMVAQDSQPDGGPFPLL